MKKIISAILLITMLFAFVSPAYASGTGKYVVVNDVTSVFSTPGIGGQKIAELTKNTVIEITEIRNELFGKAYIPKDGVTGWVQMGALKALEAPEPDDSITGIKIKQLPEKREYTDGTEELDLTGLKVVSLGKDGKEAPITGYSVYAPEMKVPGEKTVTVSYSPDGVNSYTDSFKVTVKRLPVTGISVKEKPKTEYSENQPLDLTELVVVCSFSEGDDSIYTYSQLKDNPDFRIEGCHGEMHGASLTKGTHTIKVTYKYTDIFTEFTVNVTERKLVGLTVKEQPKNLTVYDNKKIPALDGLILEAAYDNGEKEDVYHYNCEAVCDPTQFIIGPGNRVDVYFGGMYVTLEFRYSVAVPEKITLEFPKGFTLNFFKGEEIDLSPVKVRLVYSDDTFEYVTDYKMSTPDPTVTGTQHISVIYREFSEVFVINISPYFSKGDVDGNGIISSNDARQTLRAAVGLTKLNGMTFFAGDADRDDKISANDARLILRASVGLENLYITL